MIDAMFEQIRTSSLNSWLYACNSSADARADDGMFILHMLHSNTVFFASKICSCSCCCCCCTAFSVWDFICTFRLLLPANRFWHTLHSCVFVPLCDRICPVRWPELLNPRWQILHTCGFSPVSKKFNQLISHCAKFNFLLNKMLLTRSLMNIGRFLASERFITDITLIRTFSSVCNFIYSINFSFQRKVSFQIKQKKCYSRVRLWMANVFEPANALPQFCTSQKYGFSPVSAISIIQSATIWCFIWNWKKSYLRVRKWIATYPLCENDLLQTGQLNGFSPVCTFDFEQNFFFKVIYE